MLLKEVPFYSWQGNFVYWAELAKYLHSARFYASTAALGPKEPHSGVAQKIAARVRSFCLAPGPLFTPAYARQMTLRVVGPVGGGACKSESFYAGALCPCPP